VRRGDTSVAHRPMNDRAHAAGRATAVQIIGGLGLLGLAGAFVAATASGLGAWGGVAAIGGRWLFLAGLCLMVGASFVGTMIYAEPRRSLLRLSAVAWFAAGIGLMLVLLALISTPLNVPLWRVAVLRTVPLLAAGVLIAIESRAPHPSVRGMAAIGIAAAAAMLADVGTSHIAASAEPHPDHIETFVHWLHVVAVGTWLGGLAALLVSLPDLPRDQVGSAVRRFSTSAGIGIGLVAVTGLVRAVQELGPLGNLLTTDFGRLIVAKSVLLVVLAALGAGQRLVGVPAASQRLGPLRWIGRVELSVAAVVILLAAALVNVPSPA
jgi:putative copper export protein